MPPSNPEQLTMEDPEMMYTSYEIDGSDKEDRQFRTEEEMQESIELASD